MPKNRYLTVSDNPSITLPTNAEFIKRVDALAENPAVEDIIRNTPSRRAVTRFAVIEGLAALENILSPPKEQPDYIFKWKEYPTELKNIPLAVPFRMLNHHSVYIRVETFSAVDTVCKGRVSNPLPFNHDGTHVPVVDMKTGHLFWMADTKPCRPAPPFIKEPEEPIRKVYTNRSAWINEALRRKEAGHHLCAANDDSCDSVGFADGYDDSWHVLSRKIAGEVPEGSPVRILNWKTTEFIQNLMAVKVYLQSTGKEWLYERI